MEWKEDKVEEQRKTGRDKSDSVSEKSKREEKRPRECERERGEMCNIPVKAQDFISSFFDFSTKQTFCK